MMSSKSALPPAWSCTAKISPRCPMEQNTVWRAAEALARAVSPPAGARDHPEKADPARLRAWRRQQQCGSRASGPLPVLGSRSPGCRAAVDRGRHRLRCPLLPSGRDGPGNRPGRGNLSAPGNPAGAPGRRVPRDPDCHRSRLPIAEFAVDITAQAPIKFRVSAADWRMMPDVWPRSLMISRLRSSLPTRRSGKRKTS